MHFSSLAESLTAAKNPLYVLHEQLRREGHTVLDLVRGNVNEHGIVFPQDDLKEILSEAADAARVYRPDPFGQEPARKAIAEYYRSPDISTNQVVVTPGTSISYWYCFKLLAEPGDEILAPQPSYPLFDYIAKLCGVRLTAYRLVENRDWAIDLDYLEHQISTRTRAIIVISPHNPTGMVVSEDQLHGLAEIASRHQLPIVADEVFSEFLFGQDSLPRPAGTGAPLVFTLNGFSKMFALAGFKIGWLTVSGNSDVVRKALAALELISDTFLPVSEIAQFAVPLIFSRGQSFLAGYRNWVTRCRTAALAGLGRCSFVEPRGGFYVTVALRDNEEAAAVRLLKESHILVHPGYFYDIRPDHLVMTFIEEPGNVLRAFERIAQICRHEVQL